MMSVNEKPAIVLVHGAWHLPEHYADLIHKLQQAGFDVSCPRLPTCDEATRLDSDLYTDARLVRNQVVSLIEKSREVVMLLHSYGGAVGTEALKGLSLHERTSQEHKGGVKRLIYMCGFMLQVGESVGGASLPRPDPDPVKFDPATKTTSICEDPIQLFYADVEPEQAKRAASLIVPQNASAMADTITYPAWKDIPTTYLMAQKDEVLFPNWQERQIQAVKDAGVSLTVETFDCSHSPFLSRPEEMVAAIGRAIK